MNRQRHRRFVRVRSTESPPKYGSKPTVINNDLPETEVTNIKKGQSSSSSITSDYSSIQQHMHNINQNQIAQQNNKSLCFCNFEPPLCQSEGTCIKHHRAACFHAIKQEFDTNLGIPYIQHIYGCAQLEGADASHLTCNSWRFSHSTPQSIACCYEGNFCNRNLSVPEFPRLEKSKSNHLNSNSQQYQHQSFGLHGFIFLAFGFLLGFILLLAIALPIRHFCYKKGKKNKLLNRMNNKNALEGIDTVHTDGLAANIQTDILLPLVNRQQSNQFLIEDSGSGSNGLTLNQRTIALDLQMREVFARGRYGELRKAIYRGRLVAVKIFYTTEEESWRNEREIYLSQMLNHENILQYLAADITSSVESLTQMMLITDYHVLGSLYDYLRSNFLLELDEAVELAFTTISGLEHLHNSVRGTGGHYKLEIAHRDIKSKNVLVKRPGVCCLADFGLAVRYDAANGGEISPKRVNIQVGTKRYMAPELLSRTFNVANFEEFKRADIYSFSLVIWEILNCIELPSLSGETRHIDNMPYNKRNNHQRIMSQSNSSGIVSGSDPTTAAVVVDYSSAISSSSMSPLISHPFMMNYAPPGHSASTTTDSACSSVFPDGGQSMNSFSSNWIGNRMIEKQEVESRYEQKQTPKTHQLPFQSIVENDPSFEQMSEIVCEKKIRPSIDPHWANEPKMRILCSLMMECWSEQTRSRHPALKIKKDIFRILQDRNNMN